MKTDFTTLSDNYAGLGLSLRPPKWARKAAGAVIHSAAVNVQSVKKAAAAAVVTTKKNLTDLAITADKVISVTPGGIVADVIMDKENPVVNAVKVNAENLVKSAKKISMNKIVDSLTPGAQTETGGGLLKWLPVAAAGIGAVALLMGDR